MVGHIAPRSRPAAMTVRGVTVQPTRTPIVAQLEVTSDTAPTEQSKPLFTFSDDMLGVRLDSGGKLYWSWGQSEEDWIRTGC
jgi:hypothetical protein